MAREYGSKRSRRGGGVPQQMLVMVVTFILGYFTASIFDINALSNWLTSQVLENHQQKQMAVKEQTSKEQAPVKPKFEFYTLLANEKGVGAQQAATNHTSPSTQQNPSTNGAVNTASTSLRPVNSSTTVTAATATSHGVVNKQLAALTRAQPTPARPVTTRPVAPATTARKEGTFVVQVASFKARQDAEHMKGLLILKGFEVTVVPVATPTQGNWFRVIIGPYPNRVLALKAQNILARTQRLKGMVRSA